MKMHYLIIFSSVFLAGEVFSSARKISAFMGSDSNLQTAQKLLHVSSSFNCRFSYKDNLQKEHAHYLCSNGGILFQPHWSPFNPFAGFIENYNSLAGYSIEDVFLHNGGNNDLNLFFNSFLGLLKFDVHLKNGRVKPREWYSLAPLPEGKNHLKNLSNMKGFLDCYASGWRCAKKETFFRRLHGCSLTSMTIPDWKSELTCIDHATNSPWVEDVMHEGLELAKKQGENQGAGLTKDGQFAPDLSPVALDVKKNIVLTFVLDEVLKRYKGMNAHSSHKTHARERSQDYREKRRLNSKEDFQTLQSKQKEVETQQDFDEWSDDQEETNQELRNAYTPEGLILKQHAPLPHTNPVHQNGHVVQGSFLQGNMENLNNAEGNFYNY